MARKLFGTDGIRGRANEEPITAHTMLRLAMAAGARFTRGDHRHRVVIGKDTRLSGYMLEPALTSGFVSVGMDVVLVGPMPTPAIGMLTRSMRADLGVMISASHNPYYDNGIKIFGPDGYKLSDDIEYSIEALMETGHDLAAASSAQLGRAIRMEDATGRYIEFCKQTFPKALRLDGMTIVVDCAHGAAYRVAPTVLRELGADVVALGVEPDGFNINDNVGATATDKLREAVVANKADIGIALDGDADRVILVDEGGHVIDGDQLMALISKSWTAQGRVANGCLVSTVMSNLGLERFVNGLGVELHRTPVGDRYVVEHMRKNGCNIGGEQSGHIILTDFATTGDGLIAALQVLAVIVEMERPASEVLRVFEPLPQILKNVRFGESEPLELAKVREAIKAGEIRLGQQGRLVIRKSGTEPVIRVMGEGDDRDLVETVVEDIVETIAQASAA